MATRYESITIEQAALIRSAPLFFIAPADPDGDPGPLGEGPINLSPKGDSRLLVVDEHTVAYLDFVGSGNQTARHIAEGSPVTVMVCSFSEQDAGIVRLFGAGTVHDAGSYQHRDRLVEAACPGIIDPFRSAFGNARNNPRRTEDQRNRRPHAGRCRCGN